MEKAKRLKAASRPFKAKVYGKCPIENGIRGEHHTIKVGDIIVRLEKGVKWYEQRARHGVFEVECSTMYAHNECLTKLNSKKVVRY